MFKCITGKHSWTRQDDAEKCCSGYVRVLVLGGGDNPQVIAGVIAGRAWVKAETLIPQNGSGADPNCANCEGSGGANTDGSCGQCWSEVEKDTTVTIILAVAEVLQLIDPVEPDNVQHIGRGVYEALWSPTTPHEMDMELLRHTERITIVREPFHPAHLPEWTAVQFTVGTTT